MTTAADRVRLPTGTVTFMFTDVESSTQVVQRVGDERFADLLREHHRVISEAVDETGGVEVATDGDAVFAVFGEPMAAIDAGLLIQSRLPEGDWGNEPPLTVRIGIHTGSGVLGGRDYVGVDVHRASRIAGAGHGGQTLLSEVTARLVQDRFEEAEIRLLGRYRLSGFVEPAPLYQIGPGGHQFPPLRVPRAESRLPVSLSDFIGRDDEIASGLEILGHHRLITLTGPGGTGKTRLALEIARRNEPERADGAYFVSLASVKDVALVPRAVLDAVGVETAGGIEPIEHMRRWIRDRDMLLVLDNFEQLMEGAGLVSDMLSGAIRLSLIVTSRAPLRLAGERELPVPPLRIPPPHASHAEAAGADGVRLFVNRATAVRPEFALTDGNGAAVVSIVRALDGLPLAIELAASRVRSLTPELILERLSNKLLSSRSADVPSRQQTIVNAIDWSYDLLNDELRLLLEAFSVFSGPFGLDEADDVCGDLADVLEGIAELVEQSLLRQEATTTGRPRYRMLTVVREFAFAALTARGLDRDLQERHARVFTRLAEAAESEILGSAQDHWLAVLSDDHDNLRAAFEYAVSVGDAHTALRLVGALWRFWQMRGHLQEGLARVEQALSIDEGSDPVIRARALTALGGLRYWQGDWRGTLEPNREALELFAAADSERDLSEALYNMSFSLGYRGDIGEATKVLDESLAISRRIGRTIGVGRALWALGNLASYERDWARTEDYSQRAVSELRQIDAPFDLGWAWFMIAHSRLMMSRAEAAKEPLAHALEIFARVRDVSALALILGALAMLQLCIGDEKRAAFFWGASQRLQADTGVAIGEVDVNQYPAMNEFIRSIDELTNAVHEEGFNASVEEAVEMARVVLSGARG